MRFNVRKLLAAFLLCLPVSASAGIITQETFEGTQLVISTKLTNAELMTFETSEFPYTVFKMYLNRVTSRSPYRTEIIENKLPTQYFSNGVSAQMGQVYWYSFKIFFPLDFAEDRSPEVLGQWHATEDPGDDGISPPVAFYTAQSPGSLLYDRIQFNIKYSTDPVTNWSTYSGNTTYDVGSLESFRGKWTTWVMRVKWSYQGDGELTLWKNGSVAVHHVGPNCYNDVLGPKFQVGVYKWPWDPNNPAYIGTVDPEHVTQHQVERTLYIRDILIGDSVTTLRDMGLQKDLDSITGPYLQ